MEEEPKQAYDLEERLLEFAVHVVKLTKTLSNDYADRHIGNQLLRSGTAPLSHHGESQGAESPADFIHKLRLALKELRETDRWLKLIARAKLAPADSDLPNLMSETDQLIRIFVKSIATAEMRRQAR